jgi:hypothetical protein
MNEAMVLWNRISIIVLLAAQVFEVGFLVYLYGKIRRHDVVLDGLPNLLRVRDEALLADAEKRFRRATFEELNRVLKDKAEEKARNDAAQARELLLLADQK